MEYAEVAEIDVENNRSSLRRMARHKESKFSNASILNSIEKFVRTVNEMEETILFPSRLLDLAVGDASDDVSQRASKHNCEHILKTMRNTDLYRLYSIVNQMKVDLLWSQEGPAPAQSDEDQEQPFKALGCEAAGPKLGHARCPSTTSIQSVKSASSTVSSLASDSDYDAGIEMDSGLEAEEPSDRLAHLAADNFRRHLKGLHRSIASMTEAAQYLTLRYQADVGGQV